jgi:hypothetical protein
VNDKLREELLSLAAEDESVRDQFAGEGSLFDGYHPDMQAVHDRNARGLEEIIDEAGWPGRSLVGGDGAEAAWLIAQHAIAQPAFQRKCLKLLIQAAGQDEAPAWQVAYLTDRIRFNEGKQQICGTQFDWDENGSMSPWPIEDEAGVDARRQSVGLGPIGEWTEAMRRNMSESDERPPSDFVERRRQMDEWARSVGWQD